VPGHTHRLSSDAATARTCVGVAWKPHLQVALAQAQPLTSSKARTQGQINSFTRDQPGSDSNTLRKPHALGLERHTVTGWLASNRLPHNLPERVSETIAQAQVSPFGSQGQVPSLLSDLVKLSTEPVFLSSCEQF
jgi:hypothetical protein